MNIEGDETGKAARLVGAAGMCAGAQLGTIMIPVPIVGTFTGAIVGGFVGNEIGKTVCIAFSDNSRSGNSAFKEETSIADALQRLGLWHSRGLIDTAEFKAAKAKLLGLTK